MTCETVEYATCPICGYKMLPVLEFSPCGHDVNPNVSTLTEQGTVYSWTKVGVTGANQLMAMADFFDGSLRVTAPYAGERIEVGGRVRLCLGEETPYELRAVE